MLGDEGLKLLLEFWAGRIKVRILRELRMYQGTRENVFRGH